VGGLQLTSPSHGPVTNDHTFPFQIGRQLVLGGGGG
jgi:hypothetical protein